jgi:hypothetical protein
MTKIIIWCYNKYRMKHLSGRTKMRTGSVFLFLTILIVGCYGNSGNPVASDMSADEYRMQLNSPYTQIDNRYKLWGEWTFEFNEAHDNVDVIPNRELDFHFNALKFLEAGPCYDCVRIDKITPGSEPDTIFLDVTIRNPFPDGNLAYVGFDVKGILMFPATYFCAGSGAKGAYPWQVDFPITKENSIRISWKEWGDPEVLNPDGYSYRWSPAYMEAGWEGEIPILQYYEGKYASGTPNAHINAHKNYYTQEQRHMFYPGIETTRTYEIYLPPGPVIAAYAVEACWEPPDVLPVTVPADDFPLNANQAEPYYFDFIVNNNMPITEPSPGCCGHYQDCTDWVVTFERWYINDDPYIFYSGHGFWYNIGNALVECPDNENSWIPYPGLTTQWFDDGKHRMLAYYFEPVNVTYREYFVFTMIDFEIDLN